MISKEVVREVLKTLPIGYYIGRNIPVEVDDSMCSHYDILNDIIRINTIDVSETINKLPQSNSAEEDTRAMLYHELSHAMLTPKSLKPKFYINAIEDARIEYINKNYFYGVDFDSFNVRYLSNTPSDTVENAFIRFCKLHELPEKTKEYYDLQKEFQKLLKDYNIDNLNASSDESAGYYYKNDCEYIYNTFEYLFNKTQKNKKTNNNQNNQSDNSQNNENPSSGDTSSNGSDSTGNNSNDEIIISTNTQDSTDPFSQNKASYGIESNDTNENTASNQSITQNQQAGSSGRGDFKLNEEHRNKLKNITSKYEDAKFTEKLKVIISNYNNTTNRESSAMNSYAGRFDVRAVATRDDYKYFIKKNEKGNNKGYSKLHFNLFLDKSGSFHNNETTALMIIKSLCWLEKQIKDFSFTLITCDVGEQIVPKKNIDYFTSGGTKLSYKIFQTFKTVQKKNAVNFNIVLYDGEAVSNHYPPGTNGAASNFKAFNTRNTIIITDPSNAAAVTKYCPLAQKIISTNYTKELIDNLLKMLTILLK